MAETRVILAAHILDRQPRQDRDPVIPLLPPRHEMAIAEPRELAQREFVHRAFAFLKTQDVGPLRLQKLVHEVLPEPDGVDVPCGNRERHGRAPASVSRDPIHGLPEAQA